MSLNQQILLVKTKHNFRVAMQGETLPVILSTLLSILQIARRVLKPVADSVSFSAWAAHRTRSVSSVFFIIPLRDRGEQILRLFF